MIYCSQSDGKLLFSYFQTHKQNKMGMPAWGIACTVVSVILCILGLVLFVIGYKMAKKYKDRDEVEDEFGERDFEAPGMISGVRPMPSQIPSPAPETAGATPFSPDRNVKRSTSREEIQTWDQAATSAAMAQQQIQLERDITALENQKYAMDNKWEGPITVKSINGDTYTVDVVSTQEMTQIKEKISEVSGVPPETMKLSYGGMDLIPDSYMLGAFHIPSNATLHLIPVVESSSAAVGGQPLAHPSPSRLTAHNLESRNVCFI